MKIVIDTQAYDQVTVGQIKHCIVHLPYYLFRGLAKGTGKVAGWLHRITTQKTEQKPQSIQAKIVMPPSCSEARERGNW